MNTEINADVTSAASDLRIDEKRFIIATGPGRWLWTRQVDRSRTKKKIRHSHTVSTHRMLEISGRITECKIPLQSFLLRKTQSLSLSEFKLGAGLGKTRWYWLEKYLCSISSWVMWKLDPRQTLTHMWLTVESFLSQILTESKVDGEGI